MKKGIVMEIDDVFLTLLTPEGEFLRARKNKNMYVIGEEILFFPVVAEEPSEKFAWLRNLLKKKRFASAALVLLFLSATFLPLYHSNHAYAYMSIDVNPSIELGVNNKMEVIEATAYNKDGKNILAKIGGWEKKDLAALTETILEEIKKQGYLKSHHLVVISTVRTQKSEKTADSMLAENLKEIKSAVRNDQLDLKLVEGTEKDLKKAHKLGITAGKYKVKELKEKKHSIHLGGQSDSDGADTSLSSPKKDKIHVQKSTIHPMKNDDVKMGHDKALLNDDSKQKHLLKKEDTKEKKKAKQPNFSDRENGKKKQKNEENRIKKKPHNKENQKENHIVHSNQKEHQNHRQHEKHDGLNDHEKNGHGGHNNLDGHEKGNEKGNERGNGKGNGNH
ncbi:MAG: anti-sigma factor domain-containing protein [Bacillota bacterium]|nr:anti-sigma factor domain-containing protein [Bacillota bacterium]